MSYCMKRECIMKRITVVLDGVADRPNAKLDYKTPLEYANTPNLDSIASLSQLGCMLTIPEGLELGSAVANMSLMGLDPRQYRGRAAIEAAGCGVPTIVGNLYIRMNFVEFEGGSYLNSKIVSYSAHDIPTEQSLPLTDLLTRELFRSPYKAHNVGTFRNILEIEGGAGLFPLELAPAHDIIGQPISAFIKGKKEQPLYELQAQAYALLRGNGTHANGIWFWGDSVVPEFDKAEEGRCTFGETLILMGITSIAGIPNFTTDEAQPFEQFLLEKAHKAADALNGEFDRVYIHIQATDDISHERDPIGKARLVADIDRVFFPALFEAVKGDFVMGVASDHFTFSDTGGHGGEPVPYLIYDSRAKAGTPRRFTEETCQQSGVLIDAPKFVQTLESFKTL